MVEESMTTFSSLSNEDLHDRGTRRVAGTEAGRAGTRSELPNPAPVATTSEPQLRSDTTAPVTTLSATNPRPVVEPLAPDRYKLQVTISGDTHTKLRTLQDLMRHAIPNGDPASIIDRALTLLLDDVQRRKCGATQKAREPRPTMRRSRCIPAAVRRAVWERDGGQCAFVGLHGRCAERGFLEYHHLIPFAAGGSASVDNIELRCRAHNAHEARLFFGCDFVRERAPEWDVAQDANSFRNELTTLRCG